MNVRSRQSTTRSKLSKSELAVAQVVWKLGEARVRDVFQALGTDRKLDFWTVQTYLRRLKAKGFLKTRREGRADVYLAAIRPKTVIRDVVSDFVNRLFEGDAMPLVQHLIDGRGLSDEEIEQLQARLDEIKRQRGVR
jgi:predicted transcriptional regulator